MKLFSCPHCAKRIFFENDLCLSCRNPVLYDPELRGFVAAGTDTAFTCLNATEYGCNWTAPAQGSFCRACVLNKTIPDLSIDGNLKRWARVEKAKKRAIYSLLAFGLPVAPKEHPDDEVGIAFDFLADTMGSGPGGGWVRTGHDNGLITLNVSEADSSEREKMRAQMGENYRTLLGHFRHELGHYYWDRLIRDNPDRLEQSRAIFGDDRLDYEQALADHYANGAPPDWQSSHISAYAASHPWEDWAESWAHFLHIADTLEMADSLELQLGDMRTVRRNMATDPVQAEVSLDADNGELPIEPFEDMLPRWLVLSEASNSINRCMGLPDLYPFVISPVTAGKLRFVHDLLRDMPTAEKPIVRPSETAAVGVTWAPAPIPM